MVLYGFATYLPIRCHSVPGSLPERYRRCL